MADILGTAVGVISLGIQLCDGLLKYYHSFSHFREETQATCTQIEDLQITLHALDDTLKKYDFSPEAVKRIESSVRSCSMGNDALKKELEKFMDVSPPDGLRQRLVVQGKRLRYPFKESTLSKLQATVADMRENILLAIQILLLDSSGTTQTQVSELGKQLSILAHRSNAIEVSVSQTGSDVKLLLQGRVDDLRRQIRNWLDPVDVSSFHKLLQKQRQQGTGKWFLNSPNFMQWKTQPSSLLWVHGIPGAGKSVLCSTVVDSLVECCRVDENLGLGYFYFSFDDRKRRHVRDSLLRTLICQLWARLGQESDELEKLYNLCKREDRSPALDELGGLLQNLVSEFSETFIVIDALDECAEREDLLEMIAEIVDWQLSNLHVMVFSRTEDYIEEILGPFLTCKVRVENEINQDIRLYVQEQLKKDIRLKKWPEDVRQEIETRLLEKADGMFLLVARQLELVRKSRRTKDLQETLASLPGKLFEVYQRILESVDENDEKDLYKILYWLAYSERPLTLKEVAEVVVIEHGDEEQLPSVDTGLRFRDHREVLGICSSLVSTRETLWSCDTQYNYQVVKVIVLAHATVKEYLISEEIRRSAVSRFWLSAEVSHKLISEACVAYLLQFDKESSLTESTFDDWPLAQYAAQHWPLHARVIDPRNWSKRLEALCMMLFHSSPVCFANSLRIWDASRETYIDMVSSPAAKLPHPPSPICFAAKLGLLRAVELLLLEEPNSPTNPDGKGPSALHHAADSDFDMPTLVSMLIDRGLDVNLRDDIGSTPLHNAALAENLETVRLLLGRGADINAKDSMGLTALHKAVAGGRLSAIRLLLDSGADIEAKDAVGRTPMHLLVCFAEHGAAVMDILLQCGANIDSRDDTGETPLASAVQNSFESIDIVKLLLQKSANVNLADDDGYSPLHRVCLHQNSPEMIEILLHYGADVNARTNDGQTPLHLVLSNSEPSTRSVELLLNHGARVDLTTENGDTPLHIAAQIADTVIGPAVIELLLSNGADIDAEDDQSTTPLDTARLHNCETNAALLLAKGARPTPKERIEQYNKFNFSDLLLEAQAEVMKEIKVSESANVSRQEMSNFALNRELDEISDTLARNGLNPHTVDRLNALLPELSRVSGVS